MSATEHDVHFVKRPSREEREAAADAALHELRAYARRTADELARLGHLRVALQVQLAIHEIDVAIEFLESLQTANEPVHGHLISSAAVSKPGTLPALPVAVSDFPPHAGVANPTPSALAPHLIVPTHAPCTAAEHNRFPKGRF
jgi:hypothetical protein